MKKIMQLGLLFTMILSFFSVTLTTEASTQFTDVSNSYWAKSEIEYLVSKGIIKGYDDGTFKPENNVTNSQVAIMLVRALGLNTDNRPNPNLSDVSTTFHAYKEIATAIDEGFFIVNNGKFHPNEPTTRMVMARALAKAYNITGAYQGIINDVIGTENYRYVSALAFHGITNIYPDGTFRPEETVKRSNFSVFIARTIDDKFKVTNNDRVLSTSEIARINDKKVVLIEANVKNGISQGSGVIVGNGLVLTNEHVIDGMRSGTIYLNDGTEYEIEGVVVSDKIKDIALLKTTEKILNVDPVNIGTYKSLEKGEKIVAIGSPRGLQNTVSEGIVSSSRFIEGVQYIQISVPIDHGSSGGGLFNSNGELVGITTWGITDNTADLNFAVAIDEVSNWDWYFNLNFDNIPVVPFEDTSVTPVFGDISLGMTKEQVKDLETASLINEDKNTLTYIDVWVFEYSARVVYEFENNRLVAINIYHDVVNGVNDLDLLDAYFYVMLDNVSKIYGEPSILDTNWYDDNDGYTLLSLWVTNDHDMILIARIESNFSTSGGFRISSK